MLIRMSGGAWVLSGMRLLPKDSGGSNQSDRSPSDAVVLKESQRPHTGLEAHAIYCVT